MSNQDHNNSVIEWIVAPLCVGASAKILGVALLLGLYFFAAPDVGKEALHNDAYSIIGGGHQRNLTLYAFTTLVLSPLVENILIVVSTEWLRRRGKYYAGTGCLLSGLIAFFIHGAGASAVAPASAFVVYAAYYVFERSRARKASLSYIKTVLAHFWSNAIALAFWIFCQLTYKTLLFN